MISLTVVPPLSVSFRDFRGSPERNERVGGVLIDYTYKQNNVNLIIPGPCQFFKEWRVKACCEQYGLLN